MTTPLKTFMGWDPREAEAWTIAEKSIRDNASVPVDVVPLKLDQIRDVMDRPIERRDGRLWCPISQAPMATEFAISRFAVPHIQKDGWALFCDCDVLCLGDVAELFALSDPKFAVMVVKHQHTSGEATKMDNQLQTFYARKNWSSVILWNCAHPAHAALTREALNTWPGRDLHAFKWLADDQIGELPWEWNYLVGTPYPFPEHGFNRAGGSVTVKLLHYTLGGPWLPDWKPVDEAFEQLWLDARERRARLEPSLKAEDIEVSNAS